MYLTVKINGVLVAPQTLQIVEQFQGYTSSAKIIAFYPIGGPFPSQFDQVAIVNDQGTPWFTGYVSVVALDDPAKRSAQQVTVTLTCRNLTVLTDTTLITYTYTTANDYQIIQHAFANFGPPSIIVNPGNIANIMSLSAQFSNNTLTEFMNQICQATGGGWWIDASKALHYVNPTAAATPAPWGLSDTPDFKTTYPYLGAANYAGTFTSPINDLTLLGGIDLSSGKPIVVTSQNAASIAQYGQHFKGVIQNNAITSTAQAQKTADAYVAANGIPKKTLNVTTYAVGLALGQVVPFTKSAYGFNAVPMVVQGITTTLTWAADLSYGVQIDLALGDYMPSFANTFRKATSITNPVFNPVIPYTPQQFTKYTLSYNANGTPVSNVHQPSGKLYYQGDINIGPISVLNVTNTGGKIMNVSMRALTEAYPQYDAGPGVSGNPQPISVYLGINLDGQGEIDFYFLSSTLPAGSGAPGVGAGYGISTRAWWNPTLNSIMTPGVSAGPVVIQPTPSPGSSFGMFMQLEFVSSCQVNAYYFIPGFTGAAGFTTATASNSSNYTGVNFATQFEIVVFWAQRYPAS